MLAPVHRALAARSCARLAEQVARVSATNPLRPSTLRESSSVFNTKECFHCFQRNTCQGVQSTLSARALKNSVTESAACACDHLLLLLFLFLRQTFRTKNEKTNRSLLKTVFRSATTCNRCSNSSHVLSSSEFRVTRSRTALSACLRSQLTSSTNCVKRATSPSSTSLHHLNECFFMHQVAEIQHMYEHLCFRRSDASRLASVSSAAVRLFIN